jgi:hypothetical protein
MSIFRLDARFLLNPTCANANRKNKRQHVLSLKYIRKKKERKKERDKKKERKEECLCTAGI